jgi:LPXTG-motif cell wall-anchored protein
MRKTSEKRQVWSAARLVSGVATAGLAVGLLAGTAGAAGLDPITDYASYPSPLPAGCPGGETSLLGVQFDNGRGNTASDLRQLPLRSGDTLTMTWDGFAPGCEGLAVTLAVYSTHGEQFDPHTDETLVTHVSWTDGPNVLSLVVPSAGTDDVCYLQVDAVLGAPLAVIGPNGTYYNSVLRPDEGPNNLVSAKNFAAECTEPAPTPAPEVPTTPPPAEPAPDDTPVDTPVDTPTETPAPEAEAPVDVDAVVTPPTTPPVTPTTTAPVVEAEAVSTVPSTTAPEVEVLSENVSRAPSSLPRTGAATGILAAVGAGLLAAGAAVRRVGRRYADS